MHCLHMCNHCPDHVRKPGSFRTPGNIDRELPILARTAIRKLSRSELRLLRPNLKAEPFIFLHPGQVGMRSVDMTILDPKSA
jgi:hypothetical protein